MPLYRKRPVVIEAVQVSDLFASFDSRTTTWPKWAIDALESGMLQVASALADNKRLGFVIIRTLEGDQTGGYTDWVIQGVKGELYPCKDDVFRLTYEDASGDPDRWIKEIDAAGNVTANGELILARAKVREDAE